VERSGEADSQKDVEATGECVSNKKFVQENHRGRQEAKCYPLKEYYPSMREPEILAAMSGFFYIVGFGTSSIARSPRKCWELAAQVLYDQMMRKLES